jgi:hypothetical protein
MDGSESILTPVYEDHVLQPGDAAGKGKSAKLTTA